MCVDSLSRCNSFYISDTEDDEASSVSSADSEYSAIPKKVADHDTAQRTMLQCWIHDSPVRMSETFLQNTSEPSIPLQSLQWKSVTDNEGKSYERLLLTDIERDDSIAYDGDFGFQLKAVHLESQVLPGSNGVYYSQVKDKQVTNIFVVRMKMTSSNQFEQTHQSSQLKWYLFPKLEGFSLGLSLADLVQPQSPNGVDNVSILPKIQHLSSRRLPVMTNGVLSEREILIVSFEHLTSPLYLDFVDEFRRNLWGRCVSSRNDRVIYQGRELSKPLKSDDFSENSSSRKRRLSSSESSYFFDKEQSRKVVLKMVSFKKPFTTDKHKQHDRISMNEIVTQLPFINIKKDLEVLKFFQNQNQDKKDSEAGFFPEFLHCAMDYHQLYLISSYFEGNNLPRSLCYPKQPKSDDVHVLTQEIEKNAKVAFKQILQAVQRFHHAGLSHLNICVENLVCNHSLREIVEKTLSFEELDFGVIDFGFHLAQKYLPEIQRFAYQRPSAETKFNHGRYVYHCPELEIYQGNANYLADRLYNPMKVDIWQLGILLLILTTGVLPFEPVMAGGKITNYKQWIEFLEKNGVGQLLFRHANSNSNSQGCGDENRPPSMDSSSSSLFLLKDIFSTELLSLLGSLLRTDPNQRPEVEQILRHPWFRE